MAAAPRIWASPDPFFEDGPALGRLVANRTFLQALLAADPYDAYHFFPAGNDGGAALHAALADRFPALERRGALFVSARADLPARLAETPFHCMHLSDAVTHFASLMQARNALAPALFPITAVTHSLSYARFVPAFLSLLWPGSGPRDAVLATSRCAEKALERLFAGLRREYGLAERDFPAPGVRVLPLGVDTAALPAPDERHDCPGGGEAKALRAALGLGDECLFLCFGRFDHASKMDLMPLFPAFTRARALGLAPEACSLLLAGWAGDDDETPESLRRYGESLGIRTRILLRPDDETRRALYAAADVFLSPSDNLQETFGLTLAEAGAASLPAIASDFDGYRDIVVHDETGLLIPCLGFAESAFTETLSQIWFDNQYHLALAQQTALSVPHLAAAIARLGRDAPLRRRLGEAGRARVLGLFSWERSVARHVDLWDTLAALPLAPAEEARLRKSRHPQLMRFADYFQDHFSRRADAAWLENTTLRLTAGGEAAYRGLLPLHVYAGMEKLLDPEAARRLFVAARKPVSAAAALAAVLPSLSKSGSHPPEIARERALFTLLWALKQDLLEEVPASPGNAPPGA